MNITTLTRTSFIALALLLATLRGPAAELTGDKLSQAGGTPPVIDEQPIGRIITEGNSAAFSVLAHAAAPMSFQWLSNGVAMANTARLSGATNFVLNFDPVLTNDPAGYSVVVSSSGGAITSRVVSLVVSQTLFSTTVLGSTGFAMTVIGQVGDVYRAESNTNFTGFKTNGYITNVSGVAQYTFVSAGQGVFLSFRARFDRALPVLYRLDPTNGTAGFRAYGKLGQVWRCDTSSDLPHWMALATVTNLTGWVTFYDPRLTLPAVRCYRIAPP